MVSLSVFLYESDIYCNILADCKDYCFRIKKSKVKLFYIYGCRYFPHFSVLCTDFQQCGRLHDGNYVLDAGIYSIITIVAVLVHSIVRGNFS
jgi:hypothetical protein